MLTFQPHGGWVYALAFTPDGRLVTAGDGEIRLWDLAGPAETGRFSTAYAGPVAVSPDGRFLAFAGRAVQAWEVSGPEIRLAGGHRGLAEGVAFSPDGSVLAAQGSSYPLARWELPSGAALPGGWGGTRETNDGKQFPTGCVAFSPDGSLLAATHGVLSGDEKRYDAVVFLWDAATGAPRGQLRGEFHGHPARIAFSPDGRLLAAVGGPVLLAFDVAARKQLARVKPGTKHFKGLAFTPDGRRLVTVSNDKSVRLWDTVAWAEVGGYEWKIGKLLSVAVAPDGLRMAAGGSTGEVVVWDVDV